MSSRSRSPGGELGFTSADEYSGLHLTRFPFPLTASSATNRPSGFSKHCRRVFVPSAAGVFFCPGHSHKKGSGCGRRKGSNNDDMAEAEQKQINVYPSPSLSPAYMKIRFNHAYLRGDFILSMILSSGLLYRWAFPLVSIDRST